jgi:ABC-2 type transport system ATP-binding protein
MLMGLVRPTSGTAHVLGKPVSHPETYLPRVGALIESPAFYPSLSGRRNLHALAILGRHDRGAIDGLLDLVGLQGRGDDAYGQYSLGMKQRLGLAAALVPDPELLILDEPTNGLDPAGIREIRTLLRQIGDSGKTVFVSSHLLAEVQRMCDRLLILRKGRLVFAGTVDELLVHREGIVAVPADPAQLGALISICRSAGYDATEQQGGVLAHAPSNWAPTLNELAMREGIALRELRSNSGDLEETVLTMTGEGEP